MKEVAEKCREKQQNQRRLGCANCSFACCVMQVLGIWNADREAKELQGFASVIKEAVTTLKVGYCLSRPTSALC